MSRLLAEVLEATAEAERLPAGRLEAFLAAGTPVEALRVWLALEAQDELPEHAELLSRLARDVATIDAWITRQVDVILGDPRLQELEASWRGLAWLCETVEDPTRVPVRVLSATWRELVRDLERAMEFDQSTLFRKVYSAEFGTPGGQPFGILLGDYALRHGVSADWPTDDIGALRALSQVSAAAFAPFVAGIHPSFLGLEHFGELERRIDLARTFAQHEYTRWNSLRASEDARFVGLVLPRMLLRRPWADSPAHAHGFGYRESRGRASTRLFGSAVWAFGAVLARSFAETGWPASIRGVQADVEGGGLVVGPELESFATDSAAIAPKPITDMILTDRLEKELSDLGFIPLVHCPGTSLAAFYGTNSVQKPAELADARARVNARLSALLHYMLCVSRFAHYVKVIGRDKVGSFATAQECEAFLNDWLMRYASSSDDLSSELMAEYPLREGRAQISEVPGRPGVYRCVIHLRPHFQVDQMSSSVKLVTELAAPQRT